MYLKNIPVDKTRQLPGLQEQYESKNKKFQKSKLKIEMYI